MLPIHDKDGVVVSWLSSNRIYSNAGRPLGFIQSGTVFLLSGQAVGSFSSGIFLDQSGATVGFLRHARTGPAKPPTRVAPLAPKVTHIRVPDVSAPSPSTPARSMSWSPRRWHDWLSGPAPKRKTRCRIVRTTTLPLAA